MLVLTVNCHKLAPVLQFGFDRAPRASAVMAEDMRDFIEGEFDRGIQYAYQAALTRRQCRKLEDTQARMAANLEGRYKVFVRMTEPLGGREFDPDELPR